MKHAKLTLIGIAVLILASCNSYKIDVDLTPEEVSSIKTEIKSLKEAVDNYVQADSNAGTIAWKEIIELAGKYEDLGELGKAIKVYEDVLDSGEKTKAIINNLGRLYEKTEQYDKAVVMYQRINDEYFDHDYLYDITWAYIKAGDRKNAEKYFNAWQLEFQKTDEQTQQAIKKLREDEKAVKDGSS
ncbi:tetratricopeptide repeat protein [Patescibacteria group bacterium]|nr:tetratricopeptide repeat protein [Patescibacteria group bacterium]MBU1015931.1 tetratricopeptide repeat protein [Patescibacteria group bacterium]MBU1685100.1 tetratricopeptide repeat protein [Patescibacteria group bacterium]MBU1938194.1 tetratricopeptide repeat protein [Patescibacteria group bacterium]